MSTPMDESPMLPRPESADRQTSGQEPMLPTTIPPVSLTWLDPEWARADPWRELLLAGAWLPPELLEQLARDEPEAALKFVSARLSQELLEELARRVPHVAFQYVPHRLTPALRSELTAVSALPYYNIRPLLASTEP